MARSQSVDPFYNNRFALAFESGPFSSQNLAAFQTVSMPEQTVESIEYSEGVFSYARHYPGRTSFSTVTCHKGTVKGDTLLAKWIRRASEGWNYRANISIHQFHRSDLTGKTVYRDTAASRRILLINCVPMRYKPGSDFDPMSIEISVQEMEFSIERFVIFEDGNEVTPGG